MIFLFFWNSFYPSKKHFGKTKIRNRFQEMKCLQEHMFKKEFQMKYKQCHYELSEFTRMEAKDTALNTALTRACKPVIMKYCSVIISLFNILYILLYLIFLVAAWRFFSVLANKLSKSEVIRKGEEYFFPFIALFLTFRFIQYFFLLFFFAFFHIWMNLKWHILAGICE